MASRIAEAYVQIVPRIDGIGSKLSSGLSGEMGKAGQSGGNAFVGGFKKLLGPLAAVLSVAAISNFTKDLINVGEKAATSNARIGTIADSMGIFGDQAGDVAGRLVKLAEAQARATGVDQNAIKATQAKLLTFKELATTAGDVGGAFDRATTAAVDLAAAGFGSAETNAVQLGKALNDPIKGITALNRSGVTFTEQEKEKIKVLTESGQVLEAQDLILQAIEKQVGGTAEATANSSDKMNVAFELLKEELATGLLPAFDGIVEGLIPLIADIGPGLSQAIEDTVGIFKTFFGFIADNLPVIATFVGIIGAATLALNAVRIATAAWAAIQAVLNFVLAANPIGLIVIAVAALAAGIVFLATKTTFFQDIWKAMTGFVKSSWKAVSDFFVSSLDFVVQGFTDAFTGIGNFFKDIVNGYISIWENLINFIINGVNAITTAISSISFDIPSWVPVIGGKKVGVQIPKVKKVKLPRLADGGYVDRPTAAIIGEAGPEVVTPLKDFERMMGMDDNGGSRVINYYAAPNQSIDNEAALFQAMRRAKVVAQW